MARLIGELIGVYRGRPAVILGGGPSLLSDLERVPGDALRIGVNDHAGHVTRVDYSVFLDKPSLSFYALLPKDAPTISFYDVADYRLTRTVPDYGFTAGTATWVAQLLGCDPVILAGFDCHQNKQTNPYCWVPDDAERLEVLRMSLIVNKTRLRDIQNAWHRVQDGCWRPDRIFSVSGPLKDNVFPAWAPAEGSA